MENGLESTGDSRLDLAVTQWLKYDKVTPNIYCCVASSSFKYVKSDIFSVETEVQELITKPGLKNPFKWLIN